MSNHAATLSFLRPRPRLGGKSDSTGTLSVSAISFSSDALRSRPFTTITTNCVEQPWALANCLNPKPACQIAMATELLFLVGLIISFVMPMNRIIFTHRIMSTGKFTK